MFSGFYQSFLATRICFCGIRFAGGMNVWEPHYKQFAFLMARMKKGPSKCTTIQYDILALSAFITTLLVRHVMLDAIYVVKILQCFDDFHILLKIFV